MIVRHARPPEYAAVGALTLAAYLAGGHLDNEEEYAEELVNAAGRAAEAELIVAVAPDVPADVAGSLLGTVTFCRPGTAFAELARADEAEFRMLAVAGCARGRGVGAALVRECVRRAQQGGYAGMALSTLATMDSAHRLYGRLGFRRDPDRDWWPVPDIALLAYTIRF